MTTYQAALPDVLPYLLARGIDRDTAEEFRLGFVADPISGHEKFKGRLAIPSLGPTGNAYGLRFRAVDDAEPKYLGIAGQLTRLFNVRAITEAQDILCITEGELDAISLGVAGFHAVGAPGSNSWKRHHPRMFVGFLRVLVFGDGDAAGQKFAIEVCESLRNSINVRLPDGADVNSILVSEGPESIQAIVREAIERGRD